MYEILFSPKWFFGYDIIFEIFSIVATLLIFGYAYQIYKVSKKPEHKYFAIAFLLIALSFVFKILTNFEIYYSVLEPVRLGSITITRTFLYQSRVLHFFGLFMFRFLMTIAIFGIYLNVTEGGRRKSDIFIASYLIAMLTLFSIYMYFAFHLTLVILLIFICHILWKRQERRKNIYTKTIFYSFLLLLFSQVMFSALYINLVFYIFGESLQLLGYIGLLMFYVFVRVRK